jgi:hypothetical protein
MGVNGSVLGADLGGGWTVEGAKNTPYGFGIHIFLPPPLYFFPLAIHFLSSTILHPPPYYIIYINLYNIDKE